MLLQRAKFHSFLWLSSIPLCICIYHTFIHSSVDGHLSWAGHFQGLRKHTWPVVTMWADVGWEDGGGTGERDKQALRAQ